MVSKDEALTKAHLAYEHEASFSAAKAAFLASLAASGYAIVPREATAEMIAAAKRSCTDSYYNEIWRAMLAAAPKE